MQDVDINASETVIDKAKALKTECIILSKIYRKT